MTKEELIRELDAENRYSHLNTGRLLKEEIPSDENLKKAKEELKAWGSSDKHDFEVIDIMEELYPDTPTGPDYLCFTAGEDNSTIAMMVTGQNTGAVAPNIEYSTDKVTWNDLTFNSSSEDKVQFMSDIITLNNGEKIYMRGENPNGFSQMGSGGLSKSQFVMTGSIAASGDLNTLIDEVGGALTTLAEYCYSGMFIDCTSLTAAPALPATTLSDSCYSQMFFGCTALTAAPALPATTLVLNCYEGMFNDCTFAMTDDGTTFNFEFGATLPQTIDEFTYTTHYDVATWMGNTHGFAE